MSITTIEPTPRNIAAAAGTALVALLYRRYCRDPRAGDNI